MSLGYILPNGESYYGALMLSPPVEFYPPTPSPTSIPTFSMAPTVAPSSTDTSSSNNALNAGAVTGIAVGVVFVTVVAFIFLYLLVFKPGVISSLFTTNSSNKGPTSYNLKSSLIGSDQL
jgi:hypothetical protein